MWAAVDAPGVPEFEPEAARLAWEEGRLVGVLAWGGSDLPLTGFSIDRVLAGELDGQLAQLADGFREFGKPMFFESDREPNGIGAEYMGGFGPDGTEKLVWALENGRGLDEFDPSQLPHSELYADLGNPLVCDGVERLVALHRYYYDFFVHRQGLDFLTFEASWGAGSIDSVWQDVQTWGFSSQEAHDLVFSCFDYRNYYPGDEYVDWVGLTFYMLDYHVEDWPGLDEDILFPLSTHLDGLDETLGFVRQVAAGKPVIFTELGLPDGRRTDSARAAEKVNAFFEHILPRYPEIGAFAMWSIADFFVDDPEGPLYFPWDCLLRPNTQQGDAFRAIVDANSSLFHSCARFSDGSEIPNCAP